MSSPKVAFVDNSIYLGGAQYSLLLLLQHLDHARIKPFLICPPGELAQTAQSLGVPHKTIEFVNLYRTYNPFRLLRMLTAVSIARQEVSIICQNVGANVVYANGVKSALLAPSAKKTICHLRDLKVFSLAIPNLRKRIDMAIATSDATKLWAEQHLHMQPPVVPNPVADFYDHSTDELAVTKKPYQLLMVANLYPWKQHLRAFEVAVKLRKKYPDIKLIVASTDYLNNRDCSYICEIEQTRKRINADFTDLINIINVKPEAMPILYRESAALLHPVDEEPFGRCIVEAMFCELPVVALKSGGPATLLENGGGELVDGFELCKFAAAVEKVINPDYIIPTLSPDFRSTFSANKHAENITVLIEKFCKAEQV